MPDINDISGYYGDLVEWGPCPWDPWDRWGWSSIIFLVHYYAPEYLGTDETDWRDLVRSTDAHTAASALIYLEWSLEVPPPPPCVPHLLEHICRAFNTPSLAFSPHLRAVNTIRNTIDRKIVDSLPEDGPGLSLAPQASSAARHTHDLARVRQQVHLAHIRKYANSEHLDWLLIVNTGERVARDRLLLPPETWTRAEQAIGPQLAAIAALTVFAEHGPKPATERFMQLVRSESSRPGYLRDGLRPRFRSILPRGPLLGQPRTQT